MIAQTQINKVRLHSSEKQVLAAKMWLATALNNADFRPSGVSPTAVLIVRHLADPKPGRLVLDGTSLRPDAAWETAVRQSLTSCYQQAARPEQGHLPANAAAVLFADESEILACLALDLVRGDAWQRWWWQVPLRSFSSDALAALTALWCEKAIHIPAAVQLLSTWQQADRVLNRLSEPQVAGILNALAAVYDLPALLPLEKSGAANDLVHEWENGRSPSLPSEQTQTDSPANFWQTLSGWQRQPTGLTPLQLYLWGWAVSLHHNPSSARRRPFQEIAQRWLYVQQQVHIKTEQSDATAPTSRPSRSETNQSDVAAARNRETAVSPQPTTPSSSATALPSTSKAQLARTDNLSDTSLSASELAANPTLKTAVSPPSSLPTPTISTSAQPALSDPVPIAWADGVPTRLAGLFYLINLLQQFHLPACFDDTWALSQQLSPWAVLELLARGLLTDVDEALLADPVWLALAELDGRLAGTLPGADFHGTDRYEMPAAWFSKVDINKQWIWASNGRYWRIWSETGCFIYQQPLIKGQDSLAEANTWLNAAKLPLRPILNRGKFADAPLDAVSTPLLIHLPPDLRQWLSFVLPTIRCWLQIILRENSPLIPHPSSFLLRQNGRLYLSSSHIDIVMPLNSISLPVRLAGLDLDPGWLPDYGRVVQFHYET